MVFGQVLGIEDGKLTVEQKANILMSLQHERAFPSILANNFKKYEEAVGEINWRRKDDQSRADL